MEWKERFKFMLFERLECTNRGYSMWIKLRKNNLKKKKCRSTQVEEEAKKQVQSLFTQHANEQVRHHRLNEAFTKHHSFTAWDVWVKHEIGLYIQLCIFIAHFERFAS